MKVLLGIWLSFSILLNGFGFWIGKIWNGSSPGWVVGFPLVVIIASACGAYGIIKPRSYFQVVGVVAYVAIWAGLTMDKWRISILVLSAVNLLAIILAAKALNLLKAWT